MRILSSIKRYAIKPFSWVNEKFWDFIYKSLDQYYYSIRAKNPPTSLDLYDERREHGNGTD